MGAKKFTDEEVVHMLDIIKTIPNFLTSNMQEKLMLYVEIARRMEIEHKHERCTGSQVRNKFERMQEAYRKIKDNAKSSRNRHAIKYFKMLDEIFSRGLKQKRKLKTQETIIDSDNIKQESDPLLVYENFVIKEEYVDGEEDEVKCGVEKSSNEETTDESSDDGMTEEQPQTTNHKKAAQIKEQHEDEGDKSFDNIKRSFITELVESERLLVESVKELDKNYTRNFKHHCKCKEEILKRDRYEIGQILEKDRKEMLKIFDAVLDALRKPNSTQDTSDDDSLPIALMVKKKKIEEENI